MSKVLNKFITPAAVLATALAFAACEDSTSLDADLNARASLSFAATGGQSIFGDPSPPQNPVTVAGHVIVVSSIELRLSELEIEGEDDAKMEMRGGITVVALPVNGSLVTPVTATVAAGIYDEVELEVETVRLRGTFDGEPFDVTVTVDEELEIEIDPPLVVEETGTANLTVTVSIANWFSNSDGSAIDLRNMTNALRTRLAGNIEASFDAFEDDDRDGDDDDD
ncbi:MAG: hypothetical protein ACT4O1_18195 [Gemmatimonadota bacterium]